MYHDLTSTIGNHLSTGKKRVKVTQMLKAININKAQEIDNELFADLFFKKQNALSKFHEASLKKFRRRLKKAIHKDRFPKQLTENGNVIHYFNTYDINHFFNTYRINFRLAYRDDYWAISVNDQSNIIAVYIEGDVHYIECKSRSAMNKEIDNYLESFSR